MNNVFMQILQKICALSKSDYGCLIKTQNKNVVVITSHGEILGNEKNKRAFNKLIVSKKKLALNDIYKSKAFLLLTKENSFRSIYREKLLEKNKSSYHIVLLAKKKFANKKLLHTKISSQLEKLQNELANANNNKTPHVFDQTTLFEEINAPFLVTDLSQNIIKVNDSLCRLFEIGSKKITADFFRNLKFFDDKNTRVKFEELPFVKAAKQKSNVTNYKVRYSCDNSPDIWLSINSFLMNEKGKKSSFIVSLFLDITKEAELQQSFKETVNSINAVLFSTNADSSEYIFITDAVQNLFGYSPEEIYQNRFIIIRSIAKEHFQLFKNFIEKLRNGEYSSVDYKMKDRFGKEHWVRHVGVPIIRGGNITRIVGMINDVTEEKITQLKLESSEEEFRMLIDTADDLIFILNGFGYLSMVNKNGANTLGYTPDEMIGRHFLEFIDKEDESKIAEAFSKILSSNSVTTFETAFLDRFNQSIIFEIHAKPLINEGEVSGMISIGRNITNRKLDEQKIRDLNAKLIEANRIISIERERARQKINVLEELSKLKSEFISNISHELRTPLASIVGFAETISSDSDLPRGAIREFSEIIHSEGKRLTKLINDILDFSNLESGEEELKKESLDILSALDDVVASFEDQIRAKELSFTREYPKEEVILEADRKRLSQVFHNLISNAVKFTQPGGRITLLVHDYGKEVEIAVSDTGIGIPEKDLPKLFKRFSKIYQHGAPVTGAGFGLASVKQIVDMHKGVVRVKSEENKGSTFFVRLPKQQFKRG